MTVADLRLPRELRERWRLVEAFYDDSGVLAASVEEVLSGRAGVLALAAAGVAPGADRRRVHDALQRACALDHPRFVRLLEGGVAGDGAFYLIEEDTPGRDLGSLLTDRGPMEPGAAVEVADGLLQALEALHERKLVHGEVSPGTVLVDQPGDARLGGLGWALAPHELAAPARARWVQAGILGGLPRYVAPEVLLGAHPDARTDVYGAGLVLYEALAGRPAIPGDDPFDLLQRQLQDVPPRPSTTLSSAQRVGLSSLVEEVLLRALAKNPDDRFATARACREALARAWASVKTPHTPFVATPPAGVLVGNMVLGEVLGEGPAGSLHRAVHLRVRRPCAVKLLAGDGAAGREDLARFRARLRSYARIVHPDLVRALDAGVHAERLYVVSELVPGRDLGMAVAEFGPLTVPEVLHVGWRLLGPLGALHAAGFVHGAVTPTNVRVQPDGRVRLTDAGTASEPGRVRVTAEGAIVGSSAYMTPEVVSGLPVDERSDLYQWALLLWELLAGEPLGVGEPSDAASPRKRIERFALLEDRRPDVPAAFLAILRQCLDQRPDLRLPNVAAVQAAVAATLVLRPAAPGRLGPEAPTYVEAAPPAASAPTAPASPAAPAAPAAAPRRGCLGASAVLLCALALALAPWLRLPSY